MTVKTHTTDGIKVTVRIPDSGDVPEHIREQKINQLYDLLAPKSDNSNAKNNKEK